MKPENLKKAQVKIERFHLLQSHYADFTRAMSPDLPEDQHIKQQNYALDLQKEIRKTEKEIAEL